MFRLFRRKAPTFSPLADYPDSWSILKGGSELFVRVNVGYKGAVGHPDYPIKMGIAVAYVGEHSDVTQATKNAIEDAINDLLDRGQNGAVVAVITSVGEKKFYEFLSYTRNKLEFELFHRHLKQKFPNGDIQMYAKPDPTWEGYKVLLK